MFRYCALVAAVVLFALGSVHAVDDRPFMFGPTGKWRGDKVKQKKSKWTGAEDVQDALAMGDCWLYCTSGSKATPMYYTVGNLVSKNEEEYICQCYDKRNKKTSFVHCTEENGQCSGGDVTDFGFDGTYQTFFCQPGIKGFPCSKTT